IILEKIMPCPTSGNDEVLRYAREAITSAQTIEQLRQAQAVVLPLNHGLSLTDTARVIGVSPGWACQLRRRFMHGQMAGAPGGPHCRRGEAPEHAPARGNEGFCALFSAPAGGCRRQNMRLQEERKFSAPFLRRQPKAAYSLSVRSKQRWISAWGGQWHWYQCISCCTATVGCQGMLTQEYTCTHGAVDVCTGALDSLILTYDE